MYALAGRMVLGPYVMGSKGKRVVTHGARLCACLCIAGGCSPALSSALNLYVLVWALCFLGFRCIAACFLLVALDVSV